MASTTAPERGAGWVQVRAAGWAGAGGGSFLVRLEWKNPGFRAEAGERAPAASRSTRREAAIRERFPQNRRLFISRRVFLAMYPEDEDGGFRQGLSRAVESPP